MLDAWDKMLCSTATANGFVCADIYHAFNGPAGTKAAAGLLGPTTHTPRNLGTTPSRACWRRSGTHPSPDPGGHASRERGGYDLA
jgi:hypothetical protein